MNYQTNIRSNVKSYQAMLIHLTLEPLMVLCWLRESFQFFSFLYRICRTYKILKIWI